MSGQTNLEGTVMSMVRCTRCTKPKGEDGYATCADCRTYTRQWATKRELAALCKRIGITYDDALVSGLWEERLR